MFSIAGLGARNAVNESLISEEFNIDPRDFYDEFSKSRDTRQNYSNYTFPGLHFYQNEFETDRISVLYNLLLSYPSPQYMAAIISQARAMPGSARYDHQAKVDAVAALAMIHIRMQDKSRSPNRWRELAASLQMEDHYLAKVITARHLKAGDLGTINIDRSISLANEANNARQGSFDQQRTISPRNYMLTSNRTLFEAVTSNPNNPQARYFIKFAQNYQSAQRVTEPFPEAKAQLEPGLQAIENSSKAATQKADALLASVKESGNLTAQKSSLDSAVRTRVSDDSSVNVDQRSLAALARQMEQIERLSVEQGELLKQAIGHSHETGDRAVAMMPAMITVMMNTVMQRGIEYVPTLIPYARKLQAYSDGACSVVARLDHTAMVKRLTSVDADRGGLASLVAEN
jgi:mRNA-degrading endonuclease toxin of MazEF toxin-antitoxin module